MPLQKKKEHHIETALRLATEDHWHRLGHSPQLNCQPLRSFPVKPVAKRLHHQQTHANVKRTGSFPDKADEYAPGVSLQGVIPRRYALQFLLPSTAPCKSSRSSPTHGLEGRFVQFLRLHRAPLCLFFLESSFMNHSMQRRPVLARKPLQGP